MAQATHPKRLPRTPSPFAAEPSTDSDGGIILDANTDQYNFVPQKHLASHSALETPQYELALQALEPPNQAIDWCDKGFHAEFGTGEYIPLQRGRLLGFGSQGSVYETECKGIRLAWKTKYCRKKDLQTSQRREVEILKKLNHQHIVKLMGTYTQGLELGLLIWPVAVCDLATFMDDIDIFRGSLTSGTIHDIEDNRIQIILCRFRSLCIDVCDDTGAYIAAVSRLSACFGCLIGAIDYVHDQRIRHKDLKPHNVLLSCDGIWLADFGISSDFSALSNSQSEAMERGTARYFAPEVAVYERSGRAADIFSLGCIFLEMLALVKGIPLAKLKNCCPEHKGSFQENLQHRQTWFKLLKGRNAQLQHLLCEIENMLEPEPQSRPSARKLNRHFTVISQLGTAHSAALYGSCCTPEQPRTKIMHMEAEIASLRSALRKRDHYIDRLLASTPLSASQSSVNIPRPPMGPNLPAMDSVYRST